MLVGSCRFYLLLKRTRDYLNALEHIAHGHGVLASKLAKDLGRNSACLVLDEIERLIHVLNGRFAMHANSKHAEGSGLQAVVEAERASHLVFHVKRN